MQRTDVDSERARPVLDAIPVERPAAIRETPGYFRVGRRQVHGMRHRETLWHEIAPDVVVIGLVEQRAVEIEQHVSMFGQSGRECGSRDIRGVSYGPPMDASFETLV